MACAGVGTPEAVWAATFLVLFHAVAKSLLFLCVALPSITSAAATSRTWTLCSSASRVWPVHDGRHHDHVRGALPNCMLAKWGTSATADTGNVALILILGFGSAATFLFWAKWLVSWASPPIL